MLLAASLLTGFFWSAAYVLIIVRGFRDKTFAMPMGALVLNFSWELIYSVVVTPVSPVSVAISRGTRIAWLALDVVILIQFLMYWKNDYRDIPAQLFYPFFALLLAAGGFWVYLVEVDFGRLGLSHIWGHPKDYAQFFTAYCMNLIMSILFIAMFVKRKSVAGQSVYIALSKMIGSLSANVFFMKLTGQLDAVRGSGPALDQMLWPYFYVAIPIFDVTYTVLVCRQSRRQGLNPWKRP
jgi:hypothetical protein